MFATNTTPQLNSLVAFNSNEYFKIYGGSCLKENASQIRERHKINNLVNNQKIINRNRPAFNFPFLIFLKTVDLWFLNT